MPVEFRPYQDNLLRSLIRAMNNQLNPFMVAPTGSGKTLMLRMFAEHVLKHNSFKKVLITTPQNQIKHGFKGKISVTACGAKQKLSEPHVQRSKDLIRWLHNKHNTGVVLYCNASLTNPKGHIAADPFRKNADCSDILWIIDEAHHSEAAGLAKVISGFRERGGRICYASATPFNRNGVLDVLEDPEVDASAFWSLAEHMHLGFAPQIVMEHVKVKGKKQKNLNYLDYTTKSARPWAEAIASKYLKDKKPKTLVVIPPTINGGEDKTTCDTAEKLIKELGRLLPDTTCLNTVGQDKGIDVAIRRESKNKTDHDIIVSCKRFEEGTDVKSIGAVYILGMRGDRQTIQLMGRALRDKSGIDGYAEKHPDYVKQAKVVFFLPAAASKDLALQALKVIAAVQNFSLYKIIEGPSKLKTSFEKLVTPEERKNGLLEDAIEVVNTLMRKASTAVIVNDKAMLELASRSKLGQELKKAYDEGSSEVKDIVTSLAIGKSCTDHKSPKKIEKLAEQLLEVVRIVRRKKKQTKGVRELAGTKQRMSNDPNVRKILEGIVAEYAESSIDVKLGKSADAYVTELGGDNIRTWEAVLADGLDNEQRQLEQVKAICDFKATYGRYPSASSGDNREARLGQYLSRLRTSKNGTSSYRRGVVYLSSERLAATHGCSDMFKLVDFNSARANAVTQICEFHKKQHRYPSQTAANAEEAKLGRKLNNFRNAKAGRGGSKACAAPSDAEYAIANSYGLSDMFEPQATDNARANLQQQHVINIAKFYGLHARYPNQQSSDKHEKKLGQHLQSLRKASSGMGNGKLHKGTKALACKLGCADMLERINTVAMQITKLEALVCFYQQRNMLPSPTASDESERALANFRSNMRAALHSSRKTGYVYKETLGRAKKLGVFNIVFGKTKPGRRVHS